MTMRKYRHFTCRNGHNGVEKTTENDEPYSTGWEQVSITGMREAGKDDNGYAAYTCSICGLAMTKD